VISLADKGFMPIKGMQLEYRIIRRSESPMIVMLHEGLGSIQTWGEFPEVLADATNASVMVYSRDGYGSTPVSQRELPIDYIRQHALQVLPQILDQVGFSAGILLGHSDGASMCAAYAGATHDARVRGLVLMAPHFCVEEETLTEIRNAREAFMKRDLRQRLSRYHTNVDAAFMRWNDVWLKPDFARFNLAAEVANIGVRTLIIRGEDDRYGTHRQVHFAEQTCRCELKTLIMPGCGHVPHREKRAETVEVIRAFCAPLLSADAVLAGGGKAR
jgi:pimeloyl-ACP methyl ester carboxylesterase